VILAATATIAAAAGQIMATALGAPGAGRFAAVDAVVRADPSFHIGGAGGDSVSVARAARLPTADVGRVAAVPGVRSAIGDVAFPVTVASTGARGAPLPTRGGGPAHGHGWESATLTPYRLLRGAAPRGPDAVVLDAGLVDAGHLHVGERVRIATPAGAASFRLSGVAVAPPKLSGRMSSAFFSDARAQALDGLAPGFDAIAARLAADASTDADASAIRRRIARVVGHGAQVLDRRHAASADAGDPAAYDRTQLVAVLASGAGLTLGIAVFIVAGTIAFAVGGRRREIALVRAVGATPAQVRRALLAGTALIGLAGGAAGCAVATLLMRLFVRALQSVGLAPHGFTVSTSPVPYGIAVGAGLAIALAATLVAARRAVRVPPGEALVQSALPARRLGSVRILAGLLAVGGGITLVVTLAHEAVQYATLDAFCFMIAVALLGPELIGRPLALLGRPLMSSGGAGFLAGAGLTAGRFRVGAAAAAVALVVALTGTQVVSIATTQQATQRAIAAQVRADRVIVSHGGGGLPHSIAGAVRRLPGVRASAIVSTQVYLLDHGLTNDDDPWTAAGLSPNHIRDTVSFGVTAGSLDGVHGNAIAVSRTIANAGHVGVGDDVSARLADGIPARLRIVAVYRRAGGLGDLVLSPELARAHALTPVDAAVFVAGARSAATVRGLRAIAARVPGATVLDRPAYLAQVRTADRQQADSEWVIDALMVLVATLAAFNAGATAAAERRRELGLARLAGATGGQLARALTAEALFATGAGLIAGALVVLASFADAGHDPTGGSLAVPIGQAALVLGGAALLGVTGQLVPAALSRRPRPAEVAAAAEH
jgi:putative ABC transport system permease protein